MRQQPGLLQHPDRHRPHVVQRRIVATLVEPLPGLVPSRLGSVTEREQRLLTTQLGTATRHLEDLVGLHVHAGALRPQLARDRDERAVVAGVAAQMGDRNEHLARIAHRQPSSGSATAGGLQTRVTDTGRACAQIRKVIAARGHRDRGFLHVECYAVACSAQDSPQTGGTGRRRLRWNHRAGQIGAVLRVQSHSRVTPRSLRIIRTSHILKHRRLTYRPQ